MTTRQQAVFFRDKHTLDKFPRENRLQNISWISESTRRAHDLNLATAIIGMNCDASNYLDLRPREYLQIVFRSLLSRLTPLDFLEVLSSEIDDITEFPKQFDTDPLTARIKNSLPITKLAGMFGLSLKKNRCACPFHEGENKTSLSFSDKFQTFHCFSCGVKGDLIEFYRRMSQIRGGQK